MRKVAFGGCAAAVFTALAALSGVGRVPAPQAQAAARPATVATREAAYRANNIGVARLEQYDFPAAVTAFRQALDLEPGLAIARLNLGIALFYAGDAAAAGREIEAARTTLPDRPQPDYISGLLARAADQTEDAIAAFARVQRLDPADVGAAVNLGQLYLQQRKYSEAVASFRLAAGAEPYNATAAYGLATALIRSGAAADGRAAMERFQHLRDSGYSTTFSQAYLEQGRYAEAIASTGAEPELVDERVPEIGFVDATAALLASTGRRAGGTNLSVALFDLDGDGDLDLADGGPDNLTLYRNDGAKFTDITSTAFGTRSGVGAAAGIAAADYDNDGRLDLLVLGVAGPTLYRADAAGRFSDVTASAGLNQLRGPIRSAAWLDADHDGDVDLLIAGSSGAPASPARLFRNNGNGTFSDVTSEAGVAADAIVAAVPTDYDNRRDIDMLLVRSEGRPLLLRNLRDGTFRDVAAEVGLSSPDGATMAAVGDVNKDTYPDFFFGRRNGPGSLALSDGRGRFTVETAPAAASGALAAQFVDYDNDGVLDLLVIAADGPHLLRNAGGRWIDATSRAFATAAAAPLGDAVSLATGDLDGDGDIDIAVRSSKGLAIWRNDAAKPAQALRVRLAGRVSNRSGVGAKIDMRAGSLRQRLETYAATPAPAPAGLVFGLGDRGGADVVRVLWPSGVLQAETAPAGASSPMLTGVVTVQELDRKPSSCPYLYTWNGERFEFVTDFLGGGEMGYWEAPGIRNHPDPDEYVRIDGSQLRPRDGRYELRVTNELEESMFLDRVKLVVVAHPQDLAVYPNEGLRSEPNPYRLFVTSGAQPPIAARDEHGHDVLDRIARLDRRYPDDFTLERIRGYAGKHTLELTLPPSPSGRRVLLLTGWTDYAFSGDNVAAHQIGLEMTPPSLEVEAANGEWRTAIADVGFPAGRPQTVTVDLTGKVPAAARRVRIVTTMRIYWDRVLVDSSDGRGASRVTQLEPLTASLRWRGFSAEQSPDGREPFGYAYDDVSPVSPWKLLPGRYTREGNVRELLTRTDDRFVIARPGDEIALSFDASALPPLPNGWTRTFLLYADGFSKEMDINSSSPDELHPLPYHGMTRYPYAESETPRRTAAYDAYVKRYNTRIVSRPLPPLELSAPERRN